jgi:membrane protein implicated in regulation of membrane protease activity
MEPISPAFVFILCIGTISVTVLGIHTVIEDARILFVGLVGQLVTFLLAKSGTNGSFLVFALFALTVLVLVARAVIRNIRQPRIWAPLFGITTTIISAVVMYAG